MDGAHHEFQERQDVQNQKFELQGPQQVLSAPSWGLNVESMLPSSSSMQLGYASGSTTNNSFATITNSNTGAIQQGISPALANKRARKNAQSRARAAELRQLITEIEKKPPEERTAEEMEVVTKNERRRDRKNSRSRERSLNSKLEIRRILSIPDEEKTQEQRAFLDRYTKQKNRKNEGDRLRRNRMKETKAGDGTGGMRRGGPIKSEQLQNGLQTFMAPELGGSQYQQQQYLATGEGPFSMPSSYLAAALSAQQDVSFPMYQYSNPTNIQGYGANGLAQFSSALQTASRNLQGGNDMPPLPLPDAALFQQYANYQGIGGSAGEVSVPVTQQISSSATGVAPRGTSHGDGLDHVVGI